MHLDEIWWLVAPQNPLKSTADMAAYDMRVASAEAMIEGHARIRVSRIEAVQGWRYSIDTVRGLKRLYPRTQFVWLMGADNLAHFHRWRRWVALARTVPIAVFDRAPFTLSSLGARFAVRFARNRLPESSAHMLAASAAPKWAYIHMLRHPESSTALRKSLGEAAFFRHTHFQ